MNFLFAWRYFKAKKTTNAINIIAWVSAGAIAVITASFIVLLSVFNGFEGLVKSLYSSFYPDIRISGAADKTMIITDEQLRKLSSVVSVKSYSKIAEEKALLQNGDMQTIVFLKGVDEQYSRATDISKTIVRGKFELGTGDHPSIVLGSGIEYAVAADVEKSIYPMTVYLFRRGVSVNVIDPYQSFAADNIVGAGTFYIQQEIDSKYALTNLAFMKRMLMMKEEEYNSIEIAVQDPKQLNKVKKELATIFAGNYKIETRYEQNKNLYSIMTLEKWVIYGILTLMLIVAAFTMVGSLTMLVLEKEKDIQVLKAIGATNNRIQKIFLSEGLLLGFIGVLMGVILGLAICWAQVRFNLVPIQGGTFLISYYPIKIVGTDLLLVIATVMLVALLASWLPGRRAAMQAVELKS